MTIPTHKQWAALRDKAGGSAGLVKSVSIGKLLDDYEKAGVGKIGLGQMLAQVRPLGALSKGLRMYKAAVPKNKPQLLKLVDAIIKDVDGQVRNGEMFANPVNNVTSHVRDAVAHSAAIAASGDPKAYEKLWSVDLRGAGTGWAALVKIDPGLKPLYDAWQPISLDPWGLKGAKVAGNETDPVKVQAKVKAAAKQINAFAIRIQAELKKRNVTV